MSDNKIQVFENKKVRSIWDAEKEEWFFSVVEEPYMIAKQSEPGLKGLKDLQDYGCKICKKPF